MQLSMVCYDLNNKETFHFRAKGNVYLQKVDTLQIASMFSIDSLYNMKEPILNIQYLICN